LRIIYKDSQGNKVIEQPPLNSNVEAFFDEYGQPSEFIASIFEATYAKVSGPIK
jgi:hypothetical protein